MAWSRVVKTFGAVRHSDELWEAGAALRVTGGGVNINDLAAKAFGFKHGSIVTVYVDYDAIRIGLRHAANDEEKRMGYCLRSNSDDGSRLTRSGLRLACKEINDYVDEIGAMYTSFPMQLNDADRIIVVQLVNGTSHKRSKVGARAESRDPMRRRRQREA